jgi:DNA modification methylase
MSAHVVCGDCKRLMPWLPANSVDAIVTDPPYGLSFMGKGWDHGVPGVPFWIEALRVLKPGGHMLAFGGTRTYHRLAVAIEDAGFDIRDCLMWLYGSGFPKSHDVSKAIDKANGKHEVDRRKFGEYIRSARQASGLSAAEVNRHMRMPQGVGWWEGKGVGEKWDLHLPSRATYARLKTLLSLDGSFDYLIEWAEAEREVLGTSANGIAGGTKQHAGQDEAWGFSETFNITAPATDAAREWQGYGTALKPAWEPIILARKPMAGTVATNVLQHGTGALNIDGCRIAGDVPTTVHGVSSRQGEVYGKFREEPQAFTPNSAGRWPANVMLDEGAAAMLDAQSGERPAGNPAINRRGSTTGTSIGGRGTYGTASPQEVITGYGDTGGASRFFYTAKASREERNAGLRGMPERKPHADEPNGRAWDIPGSHSTPRANHHPTVKPVDLMRWLVRLITPPGGLVLDPFNGSGSTGCAAVAEGFDYLGMELDAEYVAISERRIAWWQRERELEQQQTRMFEAREEPAPFVAPVQGVLL